MTLWCVVPPELLPPLLAPFTAAAALPRRLPTRSFMSQTLVERIFPSQVLLPFAALLRRPAAVRRQVAHRPRHKQGGARSSSCRIILAHKIREFSFGCCAPPAPAMRPSATNNVGSSSSAGHLNSDDDRPTNNDCCRLVRFLFFPPQILAIARSSTGNSPLFVSAADGKGAAGSLFGWDARPANGQCTALASGAKQEACMYVGLFNADNAQRTFGAKLSDVFPEHFGSKAKASGCRRSRPLLAVRRCFSDWRLLVAGNTRCRCTRRSSPADAQQHCCEEERDSRRTDRLTSPADCSVSLLSVGPASPAQVSGQGGSSSTVLCARDLWARKPYQVPSCASRRRASSRLCTTGGRAARPRPAATNASAGNCVRLCSVVVAATDARAVAD